MASIAWAGPEHVEALVPLLRALHRHDVPEAPEPSLETICAHAVRLLDPATPHRLAVAWDEAGAAVGLAALAVVVSISDPHPDRCKQADLKELFVMPEARGQRIGAALMAWIEAEAKAANACRIDWHVKRDNHRGVAFYQQLGGSVVANRLSMRKPLQPR